ncbi:uncharacterized protein LOC143283252 [Babylonia areolata]|uniref:uncharacterized protein LOC143283252 n=1 Tax=Babylonia areolata TaxID=304850 RepID=UPI003FD49034
MMMTEPSSISQSVQGRRRRPVTASAATTPNGGRLSPEKTWLLREHLNGLYALFKAHPALMDRRLRVGSRKPHIPPHHPDYTNLIKVSTSTAATTAGIKRLISSLYFQQPQPQPQLPALPTENDYGDGDYVPAAASPPPSPPRPPVIASPPHSSSSSSSPQAEKRSFTHLSSSVVCPAHTEWRLLHVARDINNTEVEVFQPRDGAEGHQWFYTTTCDHDHDHGHDYEHHNQHRHHSVRSPESGLEDCPDCCRGVNRHRYHSHCMTKTSFVMALVRKPRERQYNWNWIQVNSSCTCYISPV